MQRIIERLEEARDSAAREQDYWIAVHAIDYGLYTVPVERKAEFDPLGMVRSGEDIARELTDEELAAAREAGEDDYWAVVGYEAHEAFDSTQGFISGLETAIQIVREETA